MHTSALLTCFITALQIREVTLAGFREHNSTVENARSAYVALYAERNGYSHRVFIGSRKSSSLPLFHFAAPCCGFQVLTLKKMSAYLVWNSHRQRIGLHCQQHWPTIWKLTTHFDQFFFVENQEE
ncbi:unnamed protein product [Cylicocyclus nassatus]|uniref:Uncharacterized protein n=1 Tax=Cylicocyclus nassatus TaxID=53992 RepID=A0AA36H0U8_CYLNA|nr:unnamed protein product [Cylicocyclus nassatus]